MRQMLLLAFVMLSYANSAFAGSPAGIPDACMSSWTLNGTPPYSYLACPQGDTDSYQDQGWSLTITVLDYLGRPVWYIPRVDFWLIDCDPNNELYLCGGAASSEADTPTDDNGVTTMSTGTLAAGGCATGIAVVVQGVVIEDSDQGCSVVQCAPIAVKSPDLVVDLVVDVEDFAVFAAGYPPNPFESCSDLDGNGLVNLQDFARFAKHYGHTCGGAMSHPEAGATVKGGAR